MYAKVTSAGLFGMNAFLVQVETDLSRGMPSFETVGLPDAAVKESRDRVRAALRNTGFEVPAAKITVNLAPADMHKTGPIYDLPIYLSLLMASGSTPANFEGAVFLGELALDGSVRRITGALPMTIMAAEKDTNESFCRKTTLLKQVLSGGLKCMAFIRHSMSSTSMKGLNR